jgi:hypothetical protein
MDEKKGLLISVSLNRKIGMSFNQTYLQQVDHLNLKKNTASAKAHNQTGLKQTCKL